MMLLATLSVMPVAVGRIDAINALYQETMWERMFGPFLGMLVVAVTSLVVKWLLIVTASRRAHMMVGRIGAVIAAGGGCRRIQAEIRLFFSRRSWLNLNLYEDP